MAKKRAQKVWRIFRFGERYELADNARFCRQSPLLFTRDFVGSGKDDESIGYAQQMQVLRMSPRRLQLKGAFGELKEIAANRSRAYRGYMLDERFNAATDSRIAMWLGLEVKEARAILKELAKIGLIERVDLPAFDTAVNQTPDGADEGPNSSQLEPARDRFKQTGKGKEETGNGNGKEKKKKKKTGKKKPVKTKKKTKKKTKAKPKGQEQPESEGKPEPEGKPVKKPEPEGKPEPERKPEDPINPTDPESGCDGRDTDKLRDDLTAHSYYIRKLFDDSKLVDRIVSATPLCMLGEDCKQFAAEVFTLLKTKRKCDPASGNTEVRREALSELAAFANAWKKARNLILAADVMEQLRESVIESAKKLGNRRGKKYRKSVEATWMWLFNIKLKKYGQMSRAPGG